MRARNTLAACAVRMHVSGSCRAPVKHNAIACDIVAKTIRIAPLCRRGPTAELPSAGAPRRVVFHLPNGPDAWIALVRNIQASTPSDRHLDWCLHVVEGDRGAAGNGQVLLHVLPVGRSDKAWYLGVAQARLLLGVCEPPQEFPTSTRSHAEVGTSRPATHHFHAKVVPGIGGRTVMKSDEVN